MALWGNRDSKSASGTLVIDTNGNVEGNGTLFTTEAKVGNTIRVAGVDYEIVKIYNDEEAKVESGVQGGAIAAVSPAAGYTLSEKPAFVAASESASTSGVTGDSNKVYGVNRLEIRDGASLITDVAIIQGGSNYTEVPAVTFSGDGTGAAATATLTGGVVTSIAVTDGGDWNYESVPTVYLQVPRRTIPTANVNTTAETISYEDHGLDTGDALTYYSSGTDLGTVSDEQTVWVIKIDVDTFKVASSLANATAGTALNLSSTGDDAQYFDLQAPAGVTATAKAVLGSGGGSGSDNAISGEQHVTHTGWVRKTVGTGGRAGRVQYETLVAMGSMQGDAQDDTAFPED